MEHFVPATNDFHFLSL